MTHWRTVAGKKWTHYIMPQFGACDKIGTYMYLSKYKVLTAGKTVRVDHVLVCLQKSGRGETDFSYIIAKFARYIYILKK